MRCWPKRAGCQPALVQIALHVAVGVNAGGLREDVLADDRLVRGHAAARKHLHELADVGQRALVDPRGDTGVIAQRHHDLVERHVARPLAHPVHRDVHAVHAGDRRFERVGRAEAVVVVAVKVEMPIGKRRDDTADQLAHLRRREQAERVGQHDAPHRHAAERLDVLVDVVGDPDHPAGPVLEIHVERDAVLRAVLDRPANVVEVLLVRLPQLLAAMVQRALRQQVDDARADRRRPVDRLIAVDKAEDLDAIGPALRLGVVDDGFHRAALALADARGRHLDAIHLDGLEQSPRDGALLLGHHRDAFGLLPVAERRIHDLDTTGFPFAHIFQRKA